MLQRKELELVMSGGIDEQTGSEVSDPQTSRSVTNLRFQGGQLSKRPTYATTATVSSPSGANYGTPYGEAIFSNRGQVFTVSDDHGVAWLDPTTGTSTYPSESTAHESGFSPRLCRVSRINLEQAQFASEGGGINQTAAALYDTHLVLAWTTTTGNTVTYLNCRAFDITTGIPLTPVKRVQMSGIYDRSHTEPCINAVKYTPNGSEGVLITYTDGSSAPITIKTLHYVASTKTFSSSLDLTTNAKYSHHSLAVNSSPSSVYFGFIDNTANAFRGKFGTVSQINGGTALAHNATTTGTVYSHILVGTGNVLVSTASTTVAYAETWNHPSNVVTVMSTASGDATPTFYGLTAALDSMIHATDGAVVWAAALNSERSVANRIRSAQIDFSSNAPSIGTASVVPNAWLATQGFTKDGRAHVGMSLFNTTLTSEATSVVLCRYAHTQSGTSVVRHDQCARFCHDVYYSTEAGTSAGFAAPVQYGDSVYFVNSTDPSADRVNGVSSFLPQEIVLTRIRFRNDLAMPCPTVEVNGVTYVASGMLWAWDGSNAFEASIVDRPTVYIDASGAGSSTFEAACSVRAIWRFVDKHGNLYRSRPSAAVSTGTFTSKRLDIYVTAPPFLALDGETAGGQQLEPEVYITAQGLSTYYLANKRSTSVKLIPSGESASGVWWEYADAIEGSSGDPQLYTNGGELDSEPPPALHDIALIQDRMWGIDAEVRNRIWYTKPKSAGFAFEWNATLTLTIQDEGEAVRDVNGVPTIFGKSGIYQVYGVGPDELGSGGFFEPARKLPHQIGCIDPNCVVKIPQGVLFRSRRGFHILGTDLSLVNVGLPIEPSTRIGSLADYSGTYTKAIYDEFHNEVRIIDGDGDTYWALNLNEGKWSKWSQDSANQYVVDLCVADGRVFNLNYNGTNTDIRREKNVDESDHNSSAEGWSMQGQYVRLDGIAGYGRVHEIVLVLNEGTNKTNVSSLTVLYEYKNSESVSGSESFVYTGSELSSMAVNNLRIKPSNQRVRSFRLTVTETCSGATTGNTPLVARAVLGVDGKAFRQAKNNQPKGTA
jgi:hypothetical protein